MKRVAVLTMHRVCNYGSVLQAWATQEILLELGCHVELVDYVFPNNYHQKYAPKVPIKIKLARMIMDQLYDYPMRRKQNAFQEFRERYLHTTKCYETKESLLNGFDNYDVYMVGSDQVWNPDVLHEDYSFFFDFIPDGQIKVSYASSFSKSKLDNYDTNKVASLLKTFSYLSVREKNAQELIKNLIGRDVPICLDPTLLLEKDDYNCISEESKIKVLGEYILVYVLNYSFNPYPFATRFIEKLNADTGLQVVCLDFSARERLRVSKCIHFHDAVGPSEFLWLFRHAKVVVTTSFHGTAFAINFGIPFYSIVNNVDTGDDRIVSLISQMGVEDRIVKKDSEIPDFTFDVDWSLIKSNLSALREKSIEFMKKTIL